MMCLRVTSSSCSRTNFRNIFFHESIIFLILACLRELALGLSPPDDLPKILGHVPEPPALLFPDDQNFRMVGDLVPTRKGALPPPIISPLADILRSRDGELGTNSSLNNLNILARLTNLTMVDPHRQNSSVNRTSRPVPVPVTTTTEEPESVTPELSAKLKASLEKEEDQFIVEPTKSAAGFVIVVVVVSIMAYVALFVWRKLLEQRYSHREMLIDEDDFCHASNLYDFNLGSDREMT